MHIPDQKLKLITDDVILCNQINPSDDSFHYREDRFSKDFIFSSQVREKLGKNKNVAFVLVEMTGDILGSENYLRSKVDILSHHDSYFLNRISFALNDALQRFEDFYEYNYSGHLQYKPHSNILKSSHIIELSNLFVSASLGFDKRSSSSQSLNNTAVIKLASSDLQDESPIHTIALNLSKIFKDIQR